GGTGLVEHRRDVGVDLGLERLRAGENGGEQLYGRDLPLPHAVGGLAQGQVHQVLRVHLIPPALSRQSSVSAANSSSTPSWRTLRCCSYENRVAASRVGRFSATP